MVPHAGLAILHGCVAAAFVEGLLRAWRVREPGQRLALRAVALLAPFVAPPLFAAAAPARSTEAFATRAALFAGAHWETLTIGGVGAATAATIALGLAGAILFLRDAMPFLADRIRGDRHDQTLPAGHPGWARLDAVRLLASAGAAAGTAPPRSAWRLTAVPDAVLFCSGLDRPVITVSLGALERLSDDELAAALAHEFAHIGHRDMRLGWALMALRAIQAFNPATQLVARQIVQEIERRADRAVASRGMGPALARAIAKLSASAAPRSDLVLPSRPAQLASAARRAVSDAVIARCEDLLVDDFTPAAGAGRWRAAAAALALGVLLFLVV